ncbi:PREDICTED: E3 ubiquitin-protein ligase TRIM71-like [Branchiostoma belcheri]|uniref:E3 ubiquitin-protein ligase TRIM71-like n=1 Tax=Branchiostoma belcheri TaxID=7741 RepID=A0A6P4Y0G6_BRABE|nr:PREDICTED: E3 ubiquitin-protein ligase TRIM71-like [Branchiostoma belcheri]
MRLSCKRAADELLVIDDTFYGWEEQNSCCGCIRLNSTNVTCENADNRENYITLSTVRFRCQGLQQCDIPIEKDTFGDPCPDKRTYLEVTYHCEEKKESVTFGGAGKELGQFQTVAGLTVSSTNEIFVADQRNERIQVFSMNGSFLRSFPTGSIKAVDITMGRNDTLWVVLYRGRSHKNSLHQNAIHQYSEDGDVLANFNCSTKSRLHGIAWHQLSDRIILTMEWGADAVWFSPSYTLTQAASTCNMTRFASTGGGQLLQFVTVDREGDILFTDWYNSRVLKYDKNGVYLSSFGSFGSGAGKLYNPSGICVDGLGRVIMADTGNSRMEMFTAEGKHIRTVAYIHKPKHVAIGGEGQLVVSNQDHLVTILLKY